MAGMLAIVAIAGAELAALRSGSATWAAITVTAVFILLLTSIVATVLGPDRSTWIGFAVFGWGYACVAFGPWFADDLRPALATSLGILESFGFVHKRASLAGDAPLRPYNQPAGIAVANATASIPPYAKPQMYAIDGRSDAGPTLVARPLGAFMMTMATPAYLAYERTAHALFAAGFGVLGGGVARFLAGRRSRTEGHRESSRP
jgi:hypothetical protein